MSPDQRQRYRLVEDGVEEWRVMEGSIGTALGRFGPINYPSIPSILSTLSIRRIRYPFLRGTRGQKDRKRRR